MAIARLGDFGPIQELHREKRPEESIQTKALTLITLKRNILIHGSKKFLQLVIIVLSYRMLFRLLMRHATCIREDGSG